MVADVDLTNARKRAFRSWLQSFFDVELPLTLDELLAWRRTRGLETLDFEGSKRRALREHAGRRLCRCGSGLPDFEDACPACFPVLPYASGPGR